MNVASVFPADLSAHRIDERALLSRIGGGDRDALRELYHAYFRRLSRFLSRLTREPRMIEEIINDTMLVVWRQAAQFRGDSQPSTWILGIAYRRALKALEHDATRVRHALQIQAHAAEEEALDTLLAQAELTDWLQRALVELSPEHRLAIELAYFVGLSCEEIATIAGCPEGTVKTRMFHARARLRDVLVALAAPRGASGSSG